MIENNDLFSEFKNIEEMYLFLDSLNKYPNLPIHLKIESMDESKSLLPFCKERIWLNNACVNVFNVVGSEDVNWVGKTWKEMLYCGKRIKENALYLISNPFYYFEKECKIPLISYTQIGNKIFVENDGNHRTALAKLLFLKMDRLQLGGVNLMSHIIDFEFKRAYDELFKLLSSQYLKIVLLKTIFAREDGIGWFREFSKLSVELTNFKNNKILLLENIDQIDSMIKEIKNRNFLSRFKRNKFIDFLY